MASSESLSSICNSVCEATSGALSSLKSSSSGPHGTENGISLLDVKNELLVGYLQALALRNYIAISTLRQRGEKREEFERLNLDLTKRLCHHRVCLERGVKPLEAKIHYQVESVLKAAEHESKSGTQKSVGRGEAGKLKDHGSDSDKAASEAGSGQDDADISQAYRPSISGYTSDHSPSHDEKEIDEDNSTKIYRPPRISAVSMPTAERHRPQEAKQARSRAVDEFISTELSLVPVVEPSVGTTIASGGRGTKDSRQLAKEAERRDYEESNLVRLPQESKKQRTKDGGRTRRSGFGGEEWDGLGASVSRIEELTRRPGRGNALDKPKKRRATEDGPRDDGHGQGFLSKKRKTPKRNHR